MIFFSSRRLGDFFCPERLGDFFCNFSCPVRLGGFFCPKRMGDFFCPEVPLGPLGGVRRLLSLKMECQSKLNVTKNGRQLKMECHSK